MLKRGLHNAVVASSGFIRLVVIQMVVRDFNSLFRPKAVFLRHHKTLVKPEYGL